MPETKKRWSGFEPPLEAVYLGRPDIARTFGRCQDTTHGPADHGLDCIWIWHDCGAILGPETVAPGERFGWRPGGVSAHTLVTLAPLTLSPSIHWPECCGLHGYIENDRWRDA